MSKLCVNMPICLYRRYVVKKEGFNSSNTGMPYEEEINRIRRYVIVVANTIHT